MLKAQLELQTSHMKDGDPRDLLENNPEAWADFMRWNAFALEDEIHEAMAEIGWKPWATSRHLNREAFMKEMVDGWHFFMNLMLAVSPGRSPAEIAHEFQELYLEKNQVNAERQQRGYTGTDKCPKCHRDLNDTARTMLPWENPEDGLTYCSKGCALELR